MNDENAASLESRILTRFDKEPWKQRYGKRSSSWSAACRPAGVLLSMWMYDVSTFDDKLPIPASRSSMPNEPGRNGAYVYQGSIKVVRDQRMKYKYHTEL